MINQNRCLYLYDKLAIDERQIVYWCCQQEQTTWKHSKGKNNKDRKRTLLPLITHSSSFRMTKW